MVHSVSGCTRGVQIKLWDPLRTRAIPERLRGMITTRRYTNPRLRLPFTFTSCFSCLIPVDILSVLNTAARSVAGFATPLTSQTFLPVPTGYVLPSELSSNWRSRSTELFMGLHLGACLIGWAALLASVSEWTSVVYFKPPRLVTIDDRPFASAGAKLWNHLPDYITSASDTLYQIACLSFFSSVVYVRPP